MKDTFTMFAAYNRWANRRLYAAAGDVAEADYMADRGAFFGSLHRTLNHIVVADLIWMSRFTGAGPVPAKLDEERAATFADLVPIREALDLRIIDFVAGLTEDGLAGEFSYRTVTNPKDMRQRLAPALSHFFNHQTHHRGQAHCLLTQITGDAPPLDLLFYQRETA